MDIIKNGGHINESTIIRHRWLLQPFDRLFYQNCQYDYYSGKGLDRFSLLIPLNIQGQFWAGDSGRILRHLPSIHQVHSLLPFRADQLRRPFLRLPSVQELHRLRGFQDLRALRRVRALQRGLKEISVMRVR